MSRMGRRSGGAALRSLRHTPNSGRGLRTDQHARQRISMALICISPVERRDGFRVPQSPSTWNGYGASDLPTRNDRPARALAGGTGAFTRGRGPSVSAGTGSGSDAG